MRQQLGCPMHRYLSDTTDDEKLHVRRGTIDSLESHMKMRFVAPGDWIRIQFDLHPLVRQACGDAYLSPGGRQVNSCSWSISDPYEHWVTHRSTACFSNFSRTWVGVALLTSRHGILLFNSLLECLLVNVIHCWTYTLPALQWIRIVTSSLMTTVFCNW